ncbi:hypothetical protein [Nonomuraea rubra]|uniref:DUF397 domain-containing protein n=1 Tax=Nonomuraea rubra TaxID=46180 RepID=A0A7X0P0W8_9ACTN|nr:hypothetical protein [Nonomuraea rubra]MBB6553238.1 hypothetical protein [Nonomuraea rubra]
MNDQLTHLAALCGNCSCGCPQVYLAPDAVADKRIVITDDFGQQIQMSADQFGDLVEKARAGEFDRVLQLELAH